jgi:photosystem II stability/assembly factor-like uncharacterized protein
MKTKHWLLMFFLITAAGASGNAQWVKQGGGLPVTWGNGLALDACCPSVAVIAVNNGLQPNIYLTKDAGAHFIPLTPPSGIVDMPIDVTIIDSLHIWYVNSTTIYATTNGGVSWQQQFSDTTITPFLDYIKMFDLSNGVAIGDAPSGKPLAVLQTTDGGAHWSNVNTSALISMASGDTWRRIDFVSRAVGYIYTSFGGDVPQKIYKTTNGGVSWSPVFAQYGVMNLKFYNEQIGLARVGAYPFPQIYRTFNGGATWDTIAVNNAQPGWGNDFEFLPGNPARVWYTDYNNLLFSNDTGRTWNQQAMDTSKVCGRDLVFTDATHGWLLCDNGRLYHTINGNQIVSSIETTEATTPSDFHLEQNFPNPFNPATNFEFRIANFSAKGGSPPASENQDGRAGASGGEFVTLKVFDVLGREVATLVNEARPAGVYKIRWDASSLPSGVYFYRLQAGAFVESKKMILMK